MRILIVNSEYPPVGGGAGNASANYAAEFTALGDEVAVLTVRFGSQAEYERVSVAPAGGYDLYRVSALRRRADRSDALGQGAFMLAASLAGLRLVKRFKPDVVFAFFGVPCGAAAWMWRPLLGVPYVVSLRGGDVPGFRPYDFALYHRLIAPLLRIVWHRAAAIVANSAGLRDLGRAFDAHVPLQFIPNGVDLGRFSPKEQTQAHAPELLFTGRVVYQKGLDVLLDALAQLTALPWRLTIVGDGSQRATLQQQALCLGLAQRITFSGWLDKEAILAYYRTADVFVFPSRHEGMPNAVLEAMASGLAVVATRIAGNEELIVNGESGLLVPVDDANALAAALQPLLLEAALRRNMGAAARRRVEEHYSWRSAALQYRQLFLQIIGH